MTPTQEAQRHMEVLLENSRSLQSVITACTPLFGKNFDVVGDDDTVLISLGWDDWTYLIDIMEPFYPHEIAKLKKRLFPNAPNPSE